MKCKTLVLSAFAATLMVGTAYADCGAEIASMEQQLSGGDIATKPVQGSQTATSAIEPAAGGELAADYSDEQREEAGQHLEKAKVFDEAGDEEGCMEALGDARGALGIE